MSEDLGLAPTPLLEPDENPVEPRTWLDRIPDEGSRIKPAILEDLDWRHNMPMLCYCLDDFDLQFPSFSA